MSAGSNSRSEQVWPVSLQSALAGICGAAWRRRGSAPPDAGAYILLIRLARDVKLAGPFHGRSLPAGTYLYCGSARGPGGIAARVRRHMRKDKAIRWHVDQLTEEADTVDCVAVPGGDECRLRRLLSVPPQASIPVPGFGSSDCRTCESHLLMWEVAD